MSLKFWIFQTFCVVDPNKKIDTRLKIFETKSKSMKNNLGFLGLGLINREGFTNKGGPTQILFCKMGSGSWRLINRERFINIMYALMIFFWLFESQHEQ